MLGIFSRRVPFLHRYWYVLIPDFQISTSEFYTAIGAELRERQVPNLEVSRVEFSEGGALSARREYLRMRRERLLFEICSAPFGTSWFFSCRFLEIPLRVKLWEFLVILGGLTGLFFLYTYVFDMLWGSILFGVSLIGLIYLLNSVVPMGFYDFDARLTRMPVIGPFYEKFIRRNTYYREDTRIMYCDLVDAVVRKQVQEFAGAKDVGEIEFKEDTSPKGTGFMQALIGLIGSIWRGSTSR